MPLPEEIADEVPLPADAVRPDADFVARRVDLVRLEAVKDVRARLTDVGTTPAKYVQVAEPSMD